MFMSVRSTAGLVALSLADAAFASAQVPPDAAAFPILLLLAAAGIGMVVFAIRERQREERRQPVPVRLRKSIRRYNQP